MTLPVLPYQTHALSPVTHARQVARARSGLITRLTDRITVNGAVRDRCGSRVPESALLLTLLRETRSHRRCQDEITRYLRRHPARAGSFDRSLIDAALGAAAWHQSRSQPWLADFDHFTAPRKRLMFRTILAIVGGARSETDSESIDYDGFASWAELTLCALKLLHLNNQGRGGPRELTFLTDRLRHGSTKPVWEGHVLAHLLALTALHRVAPGHPLVAEGVTSLLRCQNPDGGIPFIDGFEVFCTATAGLALLASSDHPRHLPPLLGDYLADSQLPDGGWAYAADVRQSDVDDTAYCLQFLRALEPGRYARHLRAGEEYLLTIANDDGGFPTFRHGHDSESAMTAGAIAALAPGRRESLPAVQRAVSHLLAAQQPDGTFGRSWSLSESNAVFRSVQALRQAPALPSSSRRARIDRAMALAAGRLMTTQHADGGWGQQPSEPGDVISTSYALLTTRHWPTSPVHRAGVAHLLAHQHPNGGFTSRPDQAGPRPLPYDVPVLADICALWALGDREAGAGVKLPLRRNE
ncbi:prenyltransferase/squalene oxidase repeat-containing protein [Streptomyces sp. NPDC048484]|uniref:prenyltransferase/squalene oxidase repeat-containing protein n=1 Tax=Streptomyces sp. NPDC048484 TaxID=3155146 RepID=UPI00342334E0